MYASQAAVGVADKKYFYHRSKLLKTLDFSVISTLFGISTTDGQFRIFA